MRMDAIIVSLIVFIIQIILGYIAKSMNDRIDKLEKKVDEIDTSYMRALSELKSLILEIRTDLIREISNLRNELTEVKVSASLKTKRGK